MIGEIYRENQGTYQKHVGKYGEMMGKYIGNMT